MVRILIFALSGLIYNLDGPGVLITCPKVEEFIDGYGFRPYDLDGDDDVDLRDVAIFMNGYNGTHYEMNVSLVKDNRFSEE